MSKKIIHLSPGDSVEIRMDKSKKTENSTEKKEFYTIQEVADKVELNYYTIHRHIKEGKLLVEKIGRSNRVSHENLTKYLKGETN